MLLEFTNFSLFIIKTFNSSSYININSIVKITNRLLLYLIPYSWFNFIFNFKYFLNLLTFINFQIFKIITSITSGNCFKNEVELVILQLKLALMLNANVSKVINYISSIDYIIAKILFTNQTFFFK